MELNNPVQAEQEAQPISTGKIIPTKQTIIIILACLILVIALAVVFFLVSQGNQEKEVYELFDPGAKREYVLKELNKMDCSYVEEVRGLVTFRCDNIQGSNAWGEANLIFDTSDKLANVLVFVPLKSTLKQTQCNTIVENLNKKYTTTDASKALAEDGGIWLSKSWAVRITTSSRVLTIALSPR